MTISYTLVPIPLWYFADDTGRPAGGGSLLTLSNLNPTIQKPVFQDAGGVQAWPNPILFDMNGQSGPFFWSFDTANANDTYYLEFRDAAGNLLWTITNYGPGVAGGGGGGGSTTTNISLKNYLVNNLLLHNIGTSSTPAPNTLTLAPSAHSGLTQPDVQFIKNVGSTANDTISFPTFGLGVNPLAPTDVTPEFFLRYTCSNIATETSKFVQWPVDLHVQNLDSQPMTAMLWARNFAGGSPSLTLQFRQFYGTPGTASADQITPIGTIALTGTWTQYIFNFTVSSSVGKTLSACGDDASYFQVLLPLSQQVTVDFIKPRLYLGTLQPGQFAELDTYDTVDSVALDWRTGDVRTSLNSFAPYGWVLMNDGTIGDGTQTGGSQARWNVDTFQLFTLIWNATSANPSFAQIYTQNGTVSTRGTSASADFIAHKQIRLPLQLGRVMASAGLANVAAGGSTGITWLIAQTTGVEQHTVALSEIPNHTHGITGQVTSTPVESGGGAQGIGSQFSTNTLGITGYSSQTALNLQNPVTYYNVFMKL